ncbi:hypothetical protein [Flavobacterium soyangense]|uniref:Uncharacterized protein n=1 Tax=Flavobacterium soyangense TaxID=2023265 RepID=A0A930XZJ0_9FLAO|nr:hypothetical protein [Flavobacterium soyangense]MBF2708948.1 hypothetical protein [Flavobacterium soyangense]
MKPVVINITNLIGTMVIIGDKENTSAQIQEKVNDALLKVIKTSEYDQLGDDKDRTDKLIRKWEECVKPSNLNGLNDFLLALKEL